MMKTTTRLVFGLLLASAALSAFSAFADSSQYAFAPEVSAPHFCGTSASKFFHAADGAVTEGGVAYFRFKFDLKSLPSLTKSSLYFYFGSSRGIVYVNGYGYSNNGSKCCEHLVEGENTITIAMTNQSVGAGMIFTLKCRDASGTDLYSIHSDETGRGTVKTPPSGWNQPGFDDSSWPNVRILGDAFSVPWFDSSWYRTSQVWNITIPADRTNFETGKYLDPSLLEELAAEPDPVASVVYSGNSPFIRLNGELRAPLLNICQVGDPYNESAVVRCEQAGLDIVQLNFYAEDFYQGDDVACDFSLLDARVRRLLELNPKAYVMVSLRFSLSDWAKAHPDERVGYGTGAVDTSASDEYRERVARPSSASDAFRELACRIIREFGAHVGKQPWRKRLIGVRPSYGVYSEWCCYGFNESPDTGKRMQEKFAAYELKKRGLADASVPTAAMRKHEFDPTNPSKNQPNKNGDLLDPSEDQLVIDYYEYLADSIADLLLMMAKEVKTVLPGRLVGAYYGYVYAADPPEGANALLEKVLLSSDIDFLSNPPAYNVDTRRAGGAFSPRTIPASFRRHGKLCLIEDDSRFHHVIDWLKSDNDGRKLCTTNAVETEACMRRNWLNQFFDGDGLQLNDPITQSGKRPHAFDDPAVFKAIADSRTALAKAGTRSAESGNTIAVVFSPRERLRMDGGKGSYFTWNICLTPFYSMYRTGAAFDILTLEDYLADPGRYTTLVFLNAFYLTEAERATIIERTRKPGMTTVWFGPAGGVTDGGFSDDAMSALTGFSAVGVKRRPEVVCNDGDRFVAGGKYCYIKTIGSGARSIVVSDFPSADSDAYRVIFEKAGAWFYTDPGSCIRRQGDVFMFHTGKAGTHTISLPKGFLKARELFSGREFSSSTIRLSSDGPATWLFKATRRKDGTVFQID